MKLTNRQLRRLISQVLQEHIDGQPFPGTLEDLANYHGKFWGHGTVVDSKGWSDAIEAGRLYTRGESPSPLRGKKKNL